MTPFEQILEKYRHRGEGRSFDEDLTHHLLHGCVTANPTCFVMVRPVSRLATPAQILDVSHRFDLAESDAWYVHAIAGSMGDVIKLIPAPGQPFLPWIGWRGLDGLVFHPTHRIARLLPASP